MREEEEGEIVTREDERKVNSGLEEEKGDARGKRVEEKRVKKRGEKERRFGRRRRREEGKRD